MKNSKSGAEFSRCRTYRYSLWRTFDLLSPRRIVMFVGLNPSTADETIDDPTIRRCINFAKAWDCTGLVMMNAFAFRATDPKVMKSADDPIGPDNDKFLSLWSKSADLVIAAWGVNCSKERADSVCCLLDRDIHCLGVTAKGFPRHPLYVRGDTKPELFFEAGVAE